MASPLSRANSGVSFYSPPPRRNAPTQRERELQARQAAMARTTASPTVRTSGGGSGRPNGAQALATRRAQIAAGTYVNPSAPEEEEEQGSAFGRGLGFLINNPLTQNALKPLEALDYGRRAMTLGVEELAKVTPEALEVLMPLMMAVDEDKSRDDERSWKDKLGQAEYGFGQITGDTGNKWLDRGIGLAGDLALDPLSYLTFGAAPAIKGTATAGRSARIANVGKAEKALRAAGLLDDDAIRALRSVAEGGYGRAKTPAMREALGIKKSGARLEIPFTNRSTGVIPGTGKLASGVNKPFDALRGGINRSERGRQLLNPRVPKALEKATPTLIGGRGTNQEFLAALDVARKDDLMRQGSGIFQGIGAQEMKPAMRRVKEELAVKYGNDIGRYLDATELDDTVTTEINKLSTKLVDTAAELGVELPEIEGIGYIPHMLSKEFRELLAESKGDAAIEKFLNQPGIVSDSKLRDAGFLEARALRPKTFTNADGTKTIKPLTLEVGSKQVDITTGSISELNEKMAQLFPQLKGSALETDPATIFERYITATAEDVGRRYSQNQLIKQGSRNAIDPRTQAVQVGDSYQRAPGDTSNPFADDSGLFRAERNELKTQAANEQIAEQAQKTIQDQRMASTDGGTAIGSDLLREEVASSASDLRKSIREPLKVESRRLGGIVGEKQAAMTEALSTTQSLAQQKRMAKKYASEAIDEVDKQLRSARQRIGVIKRQKRQKLDRMPGQQLNESLNADLNKLRDEADRLNEWLQDGVFEAFTDIKNRRAAFLADLHKAEREYQEAYEVLYGRKLPAGTSDELVDLAEAQPTTQAGRPVDDLLEPSLADNLKATSHEGADPKKFAAWQKAKAKVDEASNEASQLDRRLKEPARIEDEIERLKTQARKLHQRLDDKVNPPKGQEAADLFIDGQDLVKKIKQREASLIASRKAIRSDKVKSRLTAARKKAARAEAEFGKVEDPRVPFKKAPTEEEDIFKLRSDALEQARMRADRSPATEQTLADIGRDLGEEFTWDDVGRLFPEIAGLNADRLSREVPQRELYRRLLEELKRGGVDPVTKKPYINRLNKLPGELKQTENQLGRAVRGEGSADQIAQQFAQDEAAATRSLEMRTRQLTEGQKEIPDDLAKEIEKLNDEIGASKAEFQALKSDRDAAQAARDEVRAAQDASPASDRWRHMELASAEPENLHLRPSRKELKAASGPTVELQPMERNISEIEEMIRLNPNMDDQTLSKAEALLQQHRRQLLEASGRDLKAEAAQQVLDEASKGAFVDVVVAQINDALWRLQPDGTAVSADMARLMNNVLNLRTEPKILGRTMTAFTNFFKTYATLSPGFHVRNAISATFMNSADGVSLNYTRRGVAKWQKFMASDDPLKFYQDLDPDLRKAFDAVFATGAGGRFFESGVADATALRRGGAKEKIYRNPATVWSQKQGQRVEGAVRLGMAMDTIAKGGTVEDALSRITRIHFDYSQVSQFDESAKRLIPFWTFMSRNLPMQVTQTWMKPRRYAQYNSFVRNFKVTPDEFTPQYILDAGGFDTGEKTPESNIPGFGMDEGLPIFLQPDLAHTRIQEDLERLGNITSNPGGLLSDFNPIITAPAEQIFGKDLFTGRQYQDDDFRKASGATDLALRPLMELLGGVRENGDGAYYEEKTVDMLRSLNPILDRISRLAPTTAGGQANDRQAESMLRFIGAPVRTISDKQRENERKSRRYDQLDERRLQRVLAGG